MKPTFDHTVSVLVQAYLNDELAHGFCSACAVGNIVADAIGTKPKRGQEWEFECWLFENGETTAWYDSIGKGVMNQQCREQIEATGYTIDEIIRIEYAFESADGKPEKVGMWPGKAIDPVWMFNGLMAVVDVLAQIHGVDLSVKESAKLLFSK